MSKDKMSVANISQNDKDYQKIMYKSSRTMLLAIWRDHKKHMEYALECGRKVVRP